MTDPSGHAGDTRCTQFQTTRWSLVVAAADSRDAKSRDALAQLCQAYWYPLYAFVRRRGHDPQTAADLVQGFFAEFIDGRLLSSANPAKGRFRSYALGALKHFMAGERDRASAQKRGGGVAPVSLSDAEQRYGLEPAHDVTPERLFERRWALTLLDRVLAQLRQEHADAGQQRQFERLKDLLAGPLPDRSYADIAVELNTTEGAVKVAVHRMRQRYRRLLESQIAETIDSPQDIADEIRHLHAAISGCT